MSVAVTTIAATARTAPPRTDGARSGRPPAALWLALLATPIAMGANAPVLILPDMARSLGVSTTTATWLVTVFAWAMTIGTPLFAALIRQRGLRPTLVVSGVAVLAGTAILTTSPGSPSRSSGGPSRRAAGRGSWPWR